MNSFIDWWPAVVFGWPAVMLAVALAAFGIVRRRPAAVFIAAFVASPFSLYLGATPRFGVFGLMLPLLLIGAGFAVRSSRPLAAWSLAAPAFAVIAWVASVALRDP